MKGRKMDKYQSYELEKAKIARTAKDSDEYERRIQEVIERLNI